MKLSSVKAITGLKGSQLRVPHQGSDGVLKLKMRFEFLSKKDPAGYIPGYPGFCGARLGLLIISARVSGKSKCFSCSA